MADLDPSFLALPARELATAALHRAAAYGEDVAVARVVDLETAVDVLGGAENDRVPRDPELNPPPIRASADDAANIKGSASDRTTASVWAIARPRCVNLIAFSSIPGRGKCS